MQNIGGSILGLSIIATILKDLLYISTIIVSFKAVQALNIYINKNTK